jgi:hypothetical protein
MFCVSSVYRVRLAEKQTNPTPVSCSASPPAFRRQATLAVIAFHNAHCARIASFRAGVEFPKRPSSDTSKRERMRIPTTPPCEIYFAVT